MSEIAKALKAGEGAAGVAKAYREARPIVELGTAAAGGGKRAALCWARRHGKDDLSLHYTAIAAHTRVGSYWHMLPEYAQARKAIWDAVNPHTGIRRIDEAFPKELRARTNDQEMKIKFKNGSTWQVVGSDNVNSLVGSAVVGMVFSEFALSNPSTAGTMMVSIL